MKKLEELGISPAPWRKVYDEYGDEEAQYQVAVADARFPVGAVTLSGNYCEADAMLIAASPELYTSLHDAVEEKCTECHQINDYESDIGVEWQMCKGCQVKKWRDALAKASGEETSNG